MLRHYITKGGKTMRCGYTTGSCAAGASRAAAEMLLTGKPVDTVELDTPKGIRLTLEILDYETMKSKMGGYAVGLKHMLEDAAREDPRLTVIFG